MLFCMARDKFSIHEKCLQVNLDPQFYGTFAEIGAGQETARWFFRVGGAAGTVAKSMSAYDMTFSDAIYGASGRYVCRERLLTMLDHEYELLLQRLNEKRGAQSRFFVFANTVAARNYKGTNESHGWLGIRFQARPGTEPNNIIIHVRMLDKENLQQQEALGIIGANLVYGAFALYRDPLSLIESLIEDLSTERIEVDMIKFNGPDLMHIDNRLMSLALVQNKLSRAALFSPDGEVLQPSEALYKKAILLERGRFRPITRVNYDMLEQAKKLFVTDLASPSGEIVEIMEITMNNLLSSGNLDHGDFLARVDLLSALGKTVMISDYAEFHRLGAYLSRHTKNRIGIVLGIPLLHEIFNDKYYTDLEGGILESFGRLFKNELKLYIYPAVNPDNGEVITAENFRAALHLKHLYVHLRDNRFIIGIPCENPAMMDFNSRDVVARIASGEPGWEDLVPPKVAELIKNRQLFHYGAPKAAHPVSIPAPMMK
jgi:hypothetical protein